MVAVTPKTLNGTLSAWAAKGSDGTLRALDLLDAEVRATVRAFDGAKVSALYDDDAAQADL